MNKINERVLICGVVKNCGDKINHNINLAIKTGEIFNDYKIIIYENNSTDNTKEELNKFTDNSKILIKSEDIDLNDRNNFKLWAYTKITGSNHPCRIEMISNARNKVIDEINKSEYNQFSYVFWIDFDAHGWDIYGIIDSFNKKNMWDVIYANNTNIYYDMYAFRGGKQLFGPEIIGDLFWNSLQYFNINTQNNLISVYSAFGGLGIYKKEIFKKHKYDFIVNENVKDVYLLLLKNNRLNKEIINIIANEDTKFPGGIKDKKTNIYWKANSGYDGPVVCEHVAFNFGLIKNGYRLFINPKLIYLNS
jgi:hypothetical protein